MLRLDATARLAWMSLAASSPSNLSDQVRALSDQEGIGGCNRYSCTLLQSI